jgi:hypothetical protein
LGSIKHSGTRRFFKRAKTALQSHGVYLACQWEDRTRNVSCTHLDEATLVTGVRPRALEAHMNDPMGSDERLTLCPLRDVSSMIRGQVESCEFSPSMDSGQLRENRSALGCLMHRPCRHRAVRMGNVIWDQPFSGLCVSNASRAAVRDREWPCAIVSGRARLRVVGRDRESLRCTVKVIGWCTATNVLYWISHP